MAYALVLSSEKPIRKSNSRVFQKVLCWFRGFLPAPVQASFKQIDKELFLYIITMPPPEILNSKNRLGKKLTLKKWTSVIYNNNIEHYLLETSLKQFINGEWSMNNGGCLEKSIRKNVHLLFSMDPLKDLKMQTMTIALSGAKKEFIWPKLIPILKNFKLINVIASDNVSEDMWEEFMSETGVPVCITEDFGALARSNIWISYEENSIDYPFSGIKISTATKNILYPDKNKQYHLGYILQKRLAKKLGRKIIQSFNNQLLTEFLLHMLINKKNITQFEAEEDLGVKISVLSVESLKLCS